MNTVNGIDTWAKKIFKKRPKNATNPISRRFFFQELFSYFVSFLFADMTEEVDSTDLRSLRKKSPLTVTTMINPVGKTSPDYSGDE